MSKKNAAKFLEKLETDKKFVAEFLKLKNEADLTKMKKKYNLEFTREEFGDVYKEKHGKCLSNEELAKVIAARGGGNGSMGAALCTGFEPVL